MIKNLRKKFILAAMCAIFIVLETIIGLMNIVNYEKIKDRADRMILLIDEGDGRLPAPLKSELKKGKVHPGAVGVSPETPYETRFFTVRLDGDGKVLRTDLKNVAAVDSKEARAYAEAVFSRGAARGFEGIYRYRKTDNAEGSLLIFLDCRRELSSARSFALISFGASGLGLAAVFLLVVIFSRMIFRPVAESYEKQKQFITDASHEIKTPLTIIDANTEVLEMECGENQWTRSTRNQVRRLSVLTQQLITLARLDEDAGLRERETFSLSDAVSETAAHFEAPARMQEKQLEFNIEDGILFTGEEKAIRRMVGILLDNAVKYAVPKTRICVSLQKKGAKTILEVVNQAEGLPKGNLDKIFERFYRLDASRNSQKGGSGIGLSVAKAVVLSHKGKISAKSRDGKSLILTVVF